MAFYIRLFSSKLSSFIYFLIESLVKPERLGKRLHVLEVQITILDTVYRGRRVARCKSELREAGLNLAIFPSPVAGSDFGSRKGKRTLCLWEQARFVLCQIPAVASQAKFTSA